MKNEKKGAPKGNPTNQVDSNTKTAVLSILTNKPQDRYTLSRILGINERTFRSAVRELRREGYPIITVSNGSGYKLGTRKEAQAVAREMRSRAYDMLRTASALEAQLPGQMEMGEFL